ncbi:MAG: RloB family protein [Desulfoprunum sp.]|uniref:RloB family protein n=1 Tax=Desulfoprunum sp. TaxID=2020866 RepID=UPI003C78A2C3
MGKDNQPKHRQKARDLRRRAARTAPYERVLIVCEGEKTEPLYFKEIRHEYRLSTANVQVWPSSSGTDPLNVVDYAALLFNKGDRAKQIQPRAFDLLFAVFDRDEHTTFNQALERAKALDGRLKNDLGEPVSFRAIASVPCFELWLLLHFDDVYAPIHLRPTPSFSPFLALSSRPAPAVLSTCPRCHRNLPAVIETCPRCHLDLPPLSSRPAPAVISTAGRDLKQGLEWAPAKEQQDFSLRFEMTAGGASSTSP